MGEELELAAQKLAIDRAAIRQPKLITARGHALHDAAEEARWHAVNRQWRTCRNCQSTACRPPEYRISGREIRGA